MNSLEKKIAAGKKTEGTKGYVQVHLTERGRYGCSSDKTFYAPVTVLGVFPDGACLKVRAKIDEPGYGEFTLDPRLLFDDLQTVKESIDREARKNAAYRDQKTILAGSRVGPQKSRFFNYVDEMKAGPVFINQAIDDEQLRLPKEEDSLFYSTGWKKQVNSHNLNKLVELATQINHGVLVTETDEDDD